MRDAAFVCEKDRIIFHPILIRIPDDTDLALNPVRCPTCGGPMEVLFDHTWPKQTTEAPC